VNIKITCRHDLLTPAGYFYGRLLTAEFGQPLPEGFGCFFGFVK